MTKTSWLKIIKQLKTMRSTNKFKNNSVYYCHLDINEPIAKVGEDYILILLKGDRIYFKHADMVDETPASFLTRFRVTLNPFNVDSITFK